MCFKFPERRQRQWRRWDVAWYYLLRLQNAILQDVLVGQGHGGPLSYVQAFVLQITRLRVFRQFDGSRDCDNNYRVWHQSFSKICICELCGFGNCWIPARKLGVKRSSLSRWKRVLYPTYSGFVKVRNSRGDWSMRNKSSPSSRTRGASSLYSRYNNMRHEESAATEQVEPVTWDSIHLFSLTWSSFSSWLSSSSSAFCCSSTASPPSSPLSSPAAFFGFCRFLLVLSVSSCGSGSKLNVKKLYASSTVGSPFPACKE